MAKNKDIAENKDLNINRYIKLGGLKQINDNDLNILSKLIAEIRNQMFEQKSEELYDGNKQLYYDAVQALELMQYNNENTVTFDNAYGLPVTLTKYQASQIKTRVESSVQPIEIKKELINNLWQKLEKDTTNTPRIYSDNALNEVLENLGYEAYDLVLPAFNSLPNAQVQAPVHNYVDEYRNNALGTMELEAMLNNGAFSDGHTGNNQFNNFNEEEENHYNSFVAQGTMYNEEDEYTLDNLPNAQVQVPVYNYVNRDIGDELGTMELKAMLNNGAFSDGHTRNHQFDTFNEEEENHYNSLANFVAQGTMYNEEDEYTLDNFNQAPVHNYVDEYRNNALGTMELEAMLDNGVFNDDYTGNNQFDRINVEQDNAYLNEVDETQLISGVANIQFQQLNERPVPKPRKILKQSTSQEQVTEETKINELLKSYPGTIPVFEQLKHLNLNLSYPQIKEVVKQISKFLNNQDNQNSAVNTLSAELSTALISPKCFPDELNLVQAIIVATISCKEGYDHNNNASYLKENADHYYYNYATGLLGGSDSDSDLDLN